MGGDGQDSKLVFCKLEIPPQGPNLACKLGNYTNMGILI